MLQSDLSRFMGIATTEGNNDYNYKLSEEGLAPSGYPPIKGFNKNKIVIIGGGRPL
jgi:hypothetical protein